MITAVGLTTDPTMRYFVENCRAHGAPVELVDLAAAIERGWEIRLPSDSLSWLGSQAGRIALDPLRPAYCRLIDLALACPSDAPFWAGLVSSLACWLELAPGRVVNRPNHVNDNASKPLHEARLAARGFCVPPSFTGSNKEDLIAFAKAGQTIAKALSGQRADCRRISPDAFDDYEEESGPVHLQRFVGGDDVRAHVVGERVIALRIRARGDDYRLDRAAEFEPICLAADLVHSLVEATAECGLAFAGWDLRLSDDACWVLEVNPMPGYSYYDAKADGAISRALIDFLHSE